MRVLAGTTIAGYTFHKNFLVSLKKLYTSDLIISETSLQNVLHSPQSDFLTDQDE